MKCCNAYESESMAEMTGETLRPGGFRLTEKVLRLCKLTEADSVLDLGCGLGATVNYLYEQHQIKAVGIDPSVKLISEAKTTNPRGEFFLCSGESLPFPENHFDCVIAECTLSLMDNLERTLNQVYRVLKPYGWFVITDVYARNPEAAEELSGFAVNSCMRSLHILESLKKELERSGFCIGMCEDCSDLLKELMVKIVFRYGSMSVFWNASSQGCIDGICFQEALKKCKPGYFFLAVRKGTLKNGEEHADTGRP